MALLLIAVASLLVTQTVGAKQAGLVVFGSATDQTPLATYTQTTTATQTVGAAIAYGRYTWYLHATRGYESARVTPGTKQVFNPTIRVTKFEIEETDCMTRHKGIGTKNIIPDSAITGMTSYGESPPTYVRLTKSGWIMSTLPSWVEIDLGVNFRLYKIITKGRSYLAARYTYTYQLHYRLAAAEYTTYKENNITRIFQSHPGGSPGYNTMVTNELADHIIGRVFKIEALTGSELPGLRLEFVGCDCEPGPEMAVMTQAGKPHLMEASKVSDNDTTTCVTVEEHSPVTVFIPVPAIVRDNVTVTAMSKRDPSCPLYNPKELYPMVKLTPPFRTMIGSFEKCQLWENYAESELNIQVFNCTCSLGVCEGIYMRVDPPCSLQLCEVDVP